MRHVLLGCLLVVACSSGDDDELDASGTTSDDAGPAPTTSEPETGDTETGDTETGDTETGDAPAPTCPAPCTASCTDQGECVRVVFITAEAFTGDLGGISGADAKCQAEAEAAGLPGTYAAWLSDDATSAAEHTQVLAGDDAFVRADGRPIAPNGAAMTTMTLQQALRTAADGIAVVALESSVSPCPSQTKGAGVWTGTAQDGSPKGGATCNGWTDGSSGATALGVGDYNERSHGRWTDTCNATAGCDRLARIYCIQLP